MIKYLLALLMLTFIAPVVAAPFGISNWNPTTRTTTITIFGLPSNQLLELFVPSYTYRTIGKTDDCWILTVSSPKFPLRNGSNNLQYGWSNERQFSWTDSGNNDPANLEPKCVNGSVQNVGSNTWRVWVKNSTLKYWEQGIFNPNSQYAVVLKGNNDLGGVGSGRSLIKKLQSNKCGTVKFSFIEYWDYSFNSGLGYGYTYMDGYQIRQNGVPIYSFDLNNVSSSIDINAICRNGILYTTH